ncbi:MAG: hypothetical protein LBP54_02785 [Campylobacteraceae bacterium]|jgi:hypothetical protein|nr:hypothetical protein [Campylobacteraceae bacterium]
MEALRGFLSDYFWCVELAVAIIILISAGIGLDDGKGGKREMLWRVPVSIIAWVVSMIVIISIIAFILFLIAMAIKVIIYFVNM